jgi:hypothetical protein
MLIEEEDCIKKKEGRGLMRNVIGSGNFMNLRNSSHSPEGTYACNKYRTVLKELRGKQEKT